MIDDENRLVDADITTVMAGTVATGRTTAAVADPDATDSSDADGTDGSDADGTDGSDADGSDGAAQDSDGTDAAGA